MIRTTEAGFTLLEIILAIVLAVALVGGGIAFHSAAADTRRRLLKHVEVISARRAVMDRVTEELRGAMPYPGTAFGVAGDETEIVFITASVPGPAAWAVRNSLDDPIPPEQDVRMVGYRLRIEEDQDGEEQVVGLERTEQKILSAEAPRGPADEEKEDPAVQATLLTGHFKFLRIQYHGGRDWSPEWRGGAGNLPLAVEIVLGGEPLGEGVDPEDYEGETFRRVIFLPGSSRALSGTIIRGGPGGAAPGGARMGRDGPGGDR